MFHLWPRFFNVYWRTKWSIQLPSMRWTYQMFWVLCWAFSYDRTVSRIFSEQKFADVILSSTAEADWLKIFFSIGDPGKMLLKKYTVMQDWLTHSISQFPKSLWRKKDQYIKKRTMNIVELCAHLIILHNQQIYHPISYWFFRSALTLLVFHLLATSYYLTCLLLEEKRFCSMSCLFVDRLW